MSSKSINFVKQRIQSGECQGMENNKYKSMTELSFTEGCRLCRFDFDSSRSFKLKSNSTDENYITLTIDYNKNADFSYFTMERCCCDGTLLFYQKLIKDNLNKLLHLKTCDKRVKIPDDLYGHEVKYTVGDFLITHEYGSEFATEEKTWMRSRFSVMLPIKFEAI